ncbi:MAG: hypothetical protein E6K25_12045 [Gammaproteobacteria bacterium]|nr:MAG: hypothetical protein E6K25_12045 [Gammaproteobacteria bacterium]
MKRIACFATVAALVTSYDALAVGAIANVIEIRNCIGGRLLAVTSVDGVNVLSGATAGWDQAGYVFNPGERYQITGWRKTNAEVAAFTFTESPNSYAERTGRPANVGVIGVAIFREHQPRAVYTPPKIAPSAKQLEVPRARESNRALASQSTVAPAPAAGGLSAGIAADQAHASAPATTPSTSPAPMPEPKLGTGHGEREYSYVENTEFLRMQPEPNEVIRIRYDSLDNLMAMGIVRRPRPTPPLPNPFPDSQERQFVPDPPG